MFNYGIETPKNSGNLTNGSWYFLSVAPQNTMPRTEIQVIPRATSSKTLYTPIFYATPSSSSLSDSEVPARPVPKAYLEQMSKQHITLATKVQEVPSSRPTSPDSSGRSNALRQQVQEAFRYANGDPADGKWSSIVQLLRLNVTRRRRWLNTTIEGKVAESSSGWINAETEEEWEEWEAKWAEEDRVKKKVQNWQRDVEAPVESTSVVSISQQKEIQRVPTEQNVLAKEKRATSSPSLGFPVVKRSSLNVIGKPKASKKAAASDVAAALSTSSSKPLPRAPDKAPPELRSSQPPRPIQDLSESSFLPPSFSQIGTSTPNNKTQKRHKPEPIISAPTSESSPLPTPPSIRMYGRQKTMSTLSERRSSPTQNSRPSTLIEVRREKRARSVTPPQAVKKARVQEDSPMRTPARPPTPSVVATPITPIITQRAQLPRLIDLIASSKRKLGSANILSEVTRATEHEPKPVNVKKVRAPQLESKPPREEEDKGKATAGVSEHEGGLETEQADDLLPANILGMPTGMYDYTTPLTNDEDPDDRDRSSAYNLIASPARSLSSLAASDSDSDLQDGHANGFDPPFTSTQVDGKDKTLGWLGYNSQFDVDGNVDLVSKFMEKDVDVDFAGWLKDPSPEPDGESQ